MKRRNKIFSTYLLVISLIGIECGEALANDNLINIVNNQTKKIQELSNKVDSLETNTSKLKSEIAFLKKSSMTNKNDVTNSGSDPRTSSLKTNSVSVSNDHLNSPAAETISDVNKSAESLELKNKVVQVPKTLVNESPNNTKETKEVLPNNLIEISEDKKAYDTALILMKEGKFKDAEEKFAAFIIDYPNSNLKDKASFWYAESFYRQGVYNKAASEYLKSYKSYLNGVKAPDSLLKLSYALNALNKRQEACSMLLKLEKEFPNRSNDLRIRSEDAKSRMKCN